MTVAIMKAQEEDGVLHRLRVWQRANERHRIGEHVRAVCRSDADCRRFQAVIDRQLALWGRAALLPTIARRALAMSLGEGGHRALPEIAAAEDLARAPLAVQQRVLRLLLVQAVATIEDAVATALTAR